MTCIGFLFDVFISHLKFSKAWNCRFLLGPLPPMASCYSSLPAKRPWFQMSAWLTKIWKCLRFSGTTGTGASGDLSFNKCVLSIRWGMSSQLDICFLDCLLIALSYCSGGEEGNSLIAWWGVGVPVVGKLNASEGKMNELGLYSIYFDIPH